MSQDIKGALSSGTVLQGGAFTIVKALGQGTTAITYLADMPYTIQGPMGNVTQMGKVAIKEFFLNLECQRDASTKQISIINPNNSEKVSKFKQAFLREAIRISKLKHPHIVHVLCTFEENNTVYFVMQYLPGGSIRELIERNGALPQQRALKYAIDVAEALTEMHSQYMCHYDLKPGNIMLSQDDHATLIDFGIAKNYDSHGQETSMTPPGLTKGFAPIEQYASVKEFSPKIDVYSMGATLFNMLTAQVPAEPMNLMNQPFPPLPLGVSEELWAVVRRAMTLNASERPTMAELLSMLQAVAGVSTTVPPMQPTQPVQPVTPVQQPVPPMQPVQPMPPMQPVGPIVNPDPNDDSKTIYGDDKTGGQPNTNGNKWQPNHGNDAELQAERENHGNKKKSNWALWLLLGLLIVVIAGGGTAIGIIGIDNVKAMMGMSTKSHDTEANDEEETPGEEDLDQEGVDDVEDFALSDASGHKVASFTGKMKDGHKLAGTLTYDINDPEGKSSYEGRFVNDLREDSAAVLNYRNGDIYRGSMIADHFSRGRYYVKETGEYFEGRFKDDKPWDGYWRDSNDGVISQVQNGEELQ